MLGKNAEKIELDLSLTDKQREVFDCPAKNIVFVKGRRAGGTEGAVRKALQIMIADDPGKSHLWVDTTYGNVKKYVKRKFIPLLKPLVDRSGNPLWVWNGQDKVLTLWNGSYMDFGSADRHENLEGHAYDYFWGNESGLILWNEDLWNHTLNPMFIEGEGAKKFFIGAPKGLNKFHEFYQRGLDPAFPQWASFRHTSYDSKYVNKGEVEEARRTLAEATFAQEYLGEFRSDAGYFHNIEASGCGGEEGPEPGVDYVIGQDIGKVVDFSVSWVGRADKRKGVFCEKYNRIPWPLQVERIAALSNKYNNAPVLVDATGLGGNIGLDSLLSAGVPVIGYNFTAKSKEDLLSALSVDMEKGDTTFVSHPDTLKELRAFQQTITQGGHVKLEAPPGMHDDCVIALALMNWQFGRPSAWSATEISTVPGIGAIWASDPLLN